MKTGYKNLAINLTTNKVKLNKILQMKKQYGQWNSQKCQQSPFLQATLAGFLKEKSLNQLRMKQKVQKLFFIDYLLDKVKQIVKDNQDFHENCQEQLKLSTQSEKLLKISTQNFESSLKEIKEEFRNKELNYQQEIQGLQKQIQKLQVNLKNANDTNTRQSNQIKELMIKQQTLNKENMSLYDQNFKLQADLADATSKLRQQGRNSQNEKSDTKMIPKLMKTQSFSSKISSSQEKFGSSSPIQRKDRKIFGIKPSQFSPTLGNSFFESKEGIQKCNQYCITTDQIQEMKIDEVDSQKDINKIDNDRQQQKVKTIQRALTKNELS